jgi:penicillin-insensitive murein endopeptidase
LGEVLVPTRLSYIAFLLVLLTPLSALAGSLGDVTSKKGLASAKPVPANELFGNVKEPAPISPRSIGFYSHGCLAGAVALPVDGPA